MPVLVAAVLVVVMAVGWMFVRRRSRLDALHRRMLAHPANAATLAGLRRVQVEWKLAVGDALQPVTAADRRRFRNTVGQLYAPGDELFPLDGPPGLVWLGECLALVHPETGVVFGLRVGTYLCLLRLPPADRDRAVAVGAAWVTCPTPPHLDAAAAFGPAWIVPNIAHPDWPAFYRTAAESAGRHPPPTEP